MTTKKRNSIHSSGFISLTSREKECLYWAAQGKSSEETALILHIKTTTVESHRSQIKNKLNCVNMTQAVYEATKKWKLL